MKLIILQKKKGFTLVELLVSISVIAVLASFIFNAVVSARAKSRDSQRYSNIQQIKNALELYKSQNGGYPSSVSPSCGSAVVTNWCNSAEVSTWNTLQTYLSPFISKLPTDPKPVNGSWGGGSGGSYSYYSDDPRWYMLVFQLENPSPASVGVKDCGSTTYNYPGTGVMTVGMNCRN